MSAKQTKADAKKPAAKPGPKRPPVNPPAPDGTLGTLAGEFDSIRKQLENYAAHLRALDRKRLNGIGIKTLGFIEMAYAFAAENSEFLPHYLTIEKFGKDYAYFMNFHNLLEMNKQITELLWNITIQAADMVYSDSLEFYALVREAAIRRVDTAETIHKDLQVFFKKHKKAEGEPTGKKIKSDVNALLHGKRDGKIVIENVKPKAIGGRRRVVDEKFDEAARFGETEEGDIQ